MVDLFVSSLCLNEHPMKNLKLEIRNQYYQVLEYFLDKVGNNDITKKKLQEYREFLTGGNSFNHDIETSISKIVVCRFQPWRRKYRYWLMCDLALILLEEDRVRRGVNEISNYIKPNQQKKLEDLWIELNAGNNESPFFKGMSDILIQYQKNKRHFEKKEKKIIVTANMSAGKSTLINALIGKKIARTSQEACTGNICYLYNKAFEDEKIHLRVRDKLDFDVSEDELRTYNWNSKIQIASYFRDRDHLGERLCIIDTPGVNSSMNPEHKKITREALKNEKYDTVLYILNANKLGTDEEIAHLKWMLEHVIQEKIIFVLNKLDTFNQNADSVSESMEGVRIELNKLGYKDPTICPLSSYFALLLKEKHYGDCITEDEVEEYEFFIKKFSKDSYDLSKYYTGWKVDEKDSEIIAMSKKSGLYGLEKILFGGESYEECFYQV